MTEKTRKPFTPCQEKIADLVIKPLSMLNVRAFRISGGRIGGRFRGGAPVLLLTTTGRRSGQPRTTPLLYLRDGENVVVVASKGGMPHNPLWYGNLEANPDVEVEIGHEKKAMVARRATDEEKSALWPRLVGMYGDFDDYQARTDRNIPVVFLSLR